MAEDAVSSGCVVYANTLKGKVMIRSLQANLTISGLARRLRKADGDLSQSSKAQPIATRRMLGKRVQFFASGEHVVDGTTLSEAEQFDSQMLRFAHASLIAGAPVGDKAVLWVDASTNPVTIYICGEEIDEYLRQVRTALSVGAIDPEMILDRDSNTVHTIKEVPRWRTWPTI